MVKRNRILSPFLFFFISIFATAACASSPEATNEATSLKEGTIKIEDAAIPNNFPLISDGGLDTATFAAGCFWCVEAQFLELKGVKKVIPGYTGGTTKNPTYEDVVTGKTGHAESINIIYDSEILSFDQLVEAFFVAHDPTQLNRQGNDIGTQYRSAIFYHNVAQKKLIDYYIDKLNDEKVYPKPIVTKVEPFTKFYEAEDYHKNYYARNLDNPYCSQVIQPKLEKFKKVFADKLKK